MYSSAENPYFLSLKPTRYAEDESFFNPWQFKGIEGLSQDFEFTLECFSLHLALDAKEWLGRAMTLSLMRSTADTPRYWNGIVSTFTKGEIISGGDRETYRAYQIILKPLFSTLRLTADKRIFRNLTVPEIASQICKERCVRINTSLLRGSYPALDYVVQYEETHQRFIERLLFESGIYYYYAHEEKRHTLMLYDSETLPSSTIPTVRYDNKNKLDEEHINDWQLRRSLNPECPVSVIAQSDLLLGPPFCFRVEKTRGNPLPDEYLKGTYRITQIQHKAFNSPQGQGTSFNFPPEEKNKISTTPSGFAYPPSSGGEYFNEFTAIPSATIFKPKAIPKQLMQGPQPARVVGLKDKIIYTNETGAIKIHFPWDRNEKGIEKVGDENSSCWVPVLQSLSGKNWGTQFIPRVNDSVMVDFIDGDINQPSVVGSLYDESKRPLFKANNLEQATSGYQTRLIDKAGKTSDGHLLKFDDTPGQEAIHPTSQGDMHLTALNNLIYETGGNEVIELGGDYLARILKGSASLSAKRIEITAGKSQLVMDENSILLKPAHKLILKSKGVAASAMSLRQGDAHSCADPTHGSNSIADGSQTVFIQGLAAARVGDQTACGATITKGVDNIKVDGRPLAVMGPDFKDSHGGSATKSSTSTGAGVREVITEETFKEKPPEETIAEKFFVTQLHLSENGKQFIYAHEGVRLYLYDDAARNCTIGYGHLVHLGPTNGRNPDEKPYLQGITLEYAQTLFNHDLAQHEKRVQDSGIVVKITQNQFDALVSFTYNVGKVYKELVNYINQRDNRSACNYIMQYNKIHDERKKHFVSFGLTKRRKDEINLFNTGLSS